MTDKLDYEQFLAKLTAEQRNEWDRCAEVFAIKFGPQLAAEIADDTLSDSVCRECGKPCNRDGGPDVLWNCVCIAACQAHHRDCGREGYVCQWCRDGMPDVCAMANGEM
jgi:hypothetical protein